MLKVFRDFLDALLYRMISSNRMTKGWIFSIDILLVTTSILISYFLGIWLYPAWVLPIGLEWVVLVNALLNGLFFVLFRSQNGIIHFATYKEGWRFWVATVCANIFLLCLGLLSEYPLSMLSSVLINNFCISALFLFIFRYLIMRTYVVLIRYTGDFCQRGVVFGTGPESIATARAISVNKDKDYKLIGFISTEKERIGKRIMDLPVYHVNNNLNDIVAGYRIDMIIFPDKKQLHDNQDNLLNKCLKAELKVMLAEAPV